MYCSLTWQNLNINKGYIGKKCFLSYNEMKFPKCKTKEKYQMDN